jgi:hypothetical protein
VALKESAGAASPRGLAAVLAALALSACASVEAFLAPDADLWPRWRAHDASRATVLDHRPWERILGAYLVKDAAGVGRVAYGRVGADDRRALDAYVGGLVATPVSVLSRPQQLAYWINLYNALTVKLVLAHYPVASIQDIGISPGLLARGPWDRKLVNVEGQPLSLNDIEHRILRPIWQDARIHYAVNCASVGCPNLQPKPFDAATLDAQLDAAAREYVNDARGVRIEGGKLTVSKIYLWFREDFGESDSQVIEHLRRYAEPALADRLQKFRKIDAYAYDWSLNGRP